MHHNGLENTNTPIRLIEMTKATQILKIKFNKGIEILRRTQAEMMLELKTQKHQLENSGEAP